MNATDDPGASRKDRNGITLCFLNVFYLSGSFVFVCKMPYVRMMCTRNLSVGRHRRLHIKDCDQSSLYSVMKK